MLALLLAAVMELKSLRLTLPVILVGGLALISLILHGEDALNMLAAVLFALCGTVYGRKDTFRVMRFAVVISFAAYAVLLVMGAIQWGNSLVGERYRNNLGFYQVNAAALFFSAAFLMPFAMRRRRGWALAVLGVAAVGLFALTNTRSSAYFAAFFLFFCAVFYLLGERAGRRGAVAATASAVLLVAVCGSFVLPRVGGPQLDLLLSYRLSYFSAALDGLASGGMLFGLDDPSLVDNSYLVLLGVYGAPFLALTLFCIWRAVLNMSIAGCWMDLSLICAMLLYGTAESLLFRPEMMLTLAFWFSVFSNQRPLLGMSASSSRGARNEP